MGNTKSFLYRQRFGYGLGDFACNLIWQMISLYLLYFYTDVMKLNAASIAVMFIVCRIIDAVTDVLVGFAIDKTRTRWGKSRPWFLLSCAVCSGSITGIQCAGHFTGWETGVCICYIHLPVIHVYSGKYSAGVHIANFDG